MGLLFLRDLNPKIRLLKIILIVNGFGVAVLVVPVIIPIALGVLVQNGLARP